MSLTTWNTSLERRRFKRTVALADGLIGYLMAEEDDSCSSSSSSSSSSDVDNDDGDDMLIDETIQKVAVAVIQQHKTVYVGCVDDTIEFGRRQLVCDMNESQCVFEFRFHKCRWKA